MANPHAGARPLDIPLGLLTCAGLGLGTAVALGLGRFAYALVLPAMRTALVWSYAEAGALNAANAAGHLAGALIAARFIALAGHARCFIICGLITTVSIAATPLTDHFAMLLALRFVPGFSGALTFVAGGALAAQVSSTLGVRAAMGLGLFYAGPGLGIIVSGLTVPSIVEGAPQHWPQAWYALGVVAGLMTIVSVFAVVSASRVSPRHAPDGTATSVSLLPSLVGYLLYAAGYIGYMTFIIVAVREGGGSAREASMWWSALGLAAIASSWIWARLIGHSTNGHALASLIGLTAIASALPLFGHHPVVFAASSILFGAVFLSVVAATTHLVCLARAPAQWAVWIGYFTVAFGIGQILGPIASGAAADWVHSTDGVLWVSVVLLLAGLGCALRQRALPAQAAG